MERAETTDDGFVDLHCHSSASGGAVGTPARIAAFLKRRGCRAFALTEHQSIDSLEAARRAAEEEGIECVPGIEMSCRVEEAGAPDRVVDVVGLLFEPTAELRQTAQKALERAKLWVREGLCRLRQRGIVDITEGDLREAVRAELGPQDEWKRPLSVGPLSVTMRKRGMIDDGAPLSANDQARRLLQSVFPQEELPPRPEVGAVCDVLRRAGAVCVLAHPGGGGREPTPAQRRRLEWWLDRHVDGLEVYQRKHTRAFERMALEVVRRRKRPYSGGSDSHSYRDGGTFTRAPYACLESLRRFKAAR